VVHDELERREIIGLEDLELVRAVVERQERAARPRQAAQRAGQGLDHVLSEQHAPVGAQAHAPQPVLVLLHDELAAHLALERVGAVLVDAVARGRQPADHLEERVGDAGRPGQARAVDVLARIGAPGEAYGLAREVLGAVVTGPARLDEPALDAITTRALDRLPDGLRVAGAAAPEPADVGVARGLGQLVATLARLDAELDWGREALS
ncbi:MAG: hypothetical protein HZB46_12820, partial [Solirubrobacterales bacterium]|nr:hypothetical protein [Solirubrobacterales bacterium]